ncbi:MAG TPA: DUF5916 domain-containing protein [Bacteroidales bacterium]|nr:DUF5916 domain-containing protein [Bacteroidales bacterium]
MRSNIFILILCLFNSLVIYAGATHPVYLDDTIPADTRVYKTVRLSSTIPKIDGNLNDDCWVKDGEWSGGFLQQRPVEGAKPSNETYIKLLFDDRYIYVGIRACDDPRLIDFRPAKRDQMGGDIVGVNFDTYHDYRTVWEFNVTASGGKIDAQINYPMQMNRNWNPVWDAKVAIEDSAWTVEMRIPFSQLRYVNKPEQVWGMFVWRNHGRNSEESQWFLRPIDSPSWTYPSGTLTGLKTEKKIRRLEIMPYGLGMLRRSEIVEGDPFRQGLEHHLSGGLDVKVGLTTDFTMDVTFNPDFGQVEADPSVLNLTTYETFFEEKRPFFLEGSNLLDFEFRSRNQLFYSRRIGHNPQYNPVLQPGEYVLTPDNTSILSAVKVTGKNANGMSIGIMQSVTRKENAEISTASGPSRYQTVEPLTSYSVFRLQQDFNKANTILGGIITGTNRSLAENHLSFLPRSVYTGGLDFLHMWKGKTYYLRMNSLFSTVHGDREAITKLQYSSVHYLNRPDFDYLGIDSSLTTMTGSGGEFEIGKAGNSRLRYSLNIGYGSPMLELNDIGYLYSADFLEQNASISYVINDPFSIFRTLTASLTQDNKFNSRAYYLSSEIGGSLRSTFTNKWTGSIKLNRSFEGLNTNTLRGGPALLLPGLWENSISISTDKARAVSLNLGTGSKISDDNISRAYSFTSALTVRVGRNIQLTTGLDYSAEKENMQYVSRRRLNSEQRYIMAFLDRKTMELTFRAEYGITPELTIQYYGSPYISTGIYNNFKYITDARAVDYQDRFHKYSGEEINLDPASGIYNIDEAGTGVADYRFANPDFNFMEFRSNLVARWEYKLGSVLYLVWQHSRSGRNNNPDHSLGNNFGNLWDIYPTDILMLKFNYWFSL